MRAYHGCLLQYAVVSVILLWAKQHSWQGSENKKNGWSDVLVIAEKFKIFHFNVFDRSVQRKSGTFAWHAAAGRGWVKGDWNTSLMDLSKGVTPLQSVSSWAYACMHPDDYVSMPPCRHIQVLVSPTLVCSNTLCNPLQAWTSVCHVRSWCLPPGVTEQTEESGDSKERN